MNGLRKPGRRVCVAQSAFVGLCVASSIALPVPAMADELGRLFFTPQQRQELDRRRASNIVETEAPAVESYVTVNGQVTRSSGKTTTWINGVAHDDAYRSRDPAHVIVPGRTGGVSVKVGETLERTRGQVKDGLEGGEIRIQPGSAAR